MEPLANSVVEFSEITTLYKNRLAPPGPQGFGWGRAGRVRGEGGRPRVRIFGSGSPVEIRLFGFSPEGDTCLPVCVSTGFGRSPQRRKGHKENSQGTKSLPVIDRLWFRSFGVLGAFGEECR
jgi:hypothetical protein